MVSETEKAEEDVERRAFARVAHKAAATVTAPWGQCEGKVLDVSLGGMRLAVPRRLRIGEFVRVRVAIDDTGGPSIDPDARVVELRQSEDTGALEVGLSFVGLPRAAVHQLSLRVGHLPLSLDSAGPHTSLGAPLCAMDEAETSVELPPPSPDFELPLG